MNRKKWKLYGELKSNTIFLDETIWKLGEAIFDNKKSKVIDNEELIELLQNHSDFYIIVANAILTTCEDVVFSDENKSKDESKLFGLYWNTRLLLSNSELYKEMTADIYEKLRNNISGLAEALGKSDKMEDTIFGHIQIYVKNCVQEYFSSSSKKKVIQDIFAEFIESRHNNSVKSSSEQINKAKSQSQIQYEIILFLRSYLLKCNPQLRYSLYILADSLARLASRTGLLQIKETNLWDKGMPLVYRTFATWNTIISTCYQEYKNSEENWTNSEQVVKIFRLLHNGEIKNATSDEVYLRIRDFMAEENGRKKCSKEIRYSNYEFERACPVCSYKATFDMGECCFGSCGFFKQLDSSGKDTNLGTKKKYEQIRALMAEIVEHEFDEYVKTKKG